MTETRSYTVPEIPREFRITKKMLRYFFAENEKPISSKRLRKDVFPDEYLEELKLSNEAYKRVRKFGLKQTKIIFKLHQFDEDDLEELQLLVKTNPVRK